MADMKHLQFLWHDSNMIFPVLSKLCKILIKLGKRPAPWNTRTRISLSSVYALWVSKTFPLNEVGYKAWIDKNLPHFRDKLPN